MGTSLFLRAAPAQKLGLLRTSSCFNKAGQIEVRQNMEALEEALAQTMRDHATLASATREQEEEIVGLGVARRGEHLHALQLIPRHPLNAAVPQMVQHTVFRQLDSL